MTMDSRNHNSPPRWKPNKWMWFGVCASLIGLGASCVASVIQQEAAFYFAAALAWLSYVGLFVSLTNLHRAPWLLVLTALLGLVGSVAAADIYFGLFHAINKP